MGFELELPIGSERRLYPPGDHARKVDRFADLHTHGAQPAGEGEPADDRKAEDEAVRGEAHLDDAARGEEPPGILFEKRRVILLPPLFELPRNRGLHLLADRHEGNLHRQEEGSTADIVREDSDARRRGRRIDEDGRGGSAGGEEKGEEEETAVHQNLRSTRCRPASAGQEE